MTAQTAETPRERLALELARLDLSPEGLAIMAEGLSASDVRRMLAGTRPVPPLLLGSLADLDPVA